jgi:hypothetical protein
MEFKYVGTEITSNGALQPDVQHRAHKASRISGRLNDTERRDKYLRLETEVRTYKSLVRPILTYSVETRVDTCKTKQLLESTAMTTLNRTEGKTGLDHVTNQDIRQQCGIRPI